MKLMIIFALSIIFLASETQAAEDSDLDDREISLLAKLIKRKLDEREKTNEERKEREEKVNLVRALLRRVIGGEEAEEGAWPWLVSLQADIPTKKFWGITMRSSEFYCGASLIDKQWILTAAHCFDLESRIPSKYWDEISKPDNYEARFGDNELEASLWEKIVGFAGKVIDKDEWKIQDWKIEAEKIFIHPGYIKNRGSKGKWANDIALVKLSEEVPAQPEHIEEIQDVSLAEDPNFPADNQECIFKGWGCTEAGGRVSSTTHQVELHKLDDRQCERLFHIDMSTRVCAGRNNANRGICPGDSGGPLVCKVGRTWVQVGVASFSAKDEPGQNPSVFTRVSAYIDWIKKTMRDN